VFSGQVLTALATLIGIRLLTEFVSPKVYGTVALMIGLVTLGQNVFCAPLLQAAYRFYPDAALLRDVRGLRQTVSALLMKTTAVIVGIIVITGATCSLVKGIPYIVFLALAGLLVVDVCRLLEINLLSAARRQRPVAIWQAAEAFVKPGVALIAVILIGATSQAILLGYLVATGGILLFVHLSRFKFEGMDSSHSNGKVGKHLKKEIIHYALPLASLALVGWISSLSDRYIIGGLLGLRDVGIYAAAYGLINRPFMMASGVVSSTLNPVYNQSVSVQNKRLEKRIFRVWLLSTAAISAIGIVAIYFLSKWVALFCLAKEYRTGAVLMPWFAFGFSNLSLAYVFEKVLYAHKKTKLILIGQSVAAISSLAIVIPMTLQWGLRGTAAACPIYFLINLLVMLTFSFMVNKQQ